MLDVWRIKNEKVEYFYTSINIKGVLIKVHERNRYTHTHTHTKVYWKEVVHVITEAKKNRPRKSQLDSSSPSPKAK